MSQLSRRDIRLKCQVYQGVVVQIEMLHERQDDLRTFQEDTYDPVKKLSVGLDWKLSDRRWIISKEQYFKETLTRLKC